MANSAEGPRGRKTKGVTALEEDKAMVESGVIWKRDNAI